MVRNEDNTIKKFIGTAVTIVFVIFLMSLVLGTFYTIKAGHRGVLLTWGDAAEQPVMEGLHFKVPIMQRIIKMNVQEQKFITQATAATRDKQDVLTEVAINYYVDQASVVELYENIGLSYEQKIIAPALQAVTKSATAQFKADDLLHSRDQVQALVQEGMMDKMAGKGLIMTNVFIEDMRFSELYSKEIEATALAEQARMRAENDLERIEVEAQQAIAKAEGEAAARIERANAQAAEKLALAEAEAKALALQRIEIDDRILELRRIEVELEYAKHYKGDVPRFVMNGGGSMPMIWQMPGDIFGTESVDTVPEKVVVGGGAS